MKQLSVKNGPCLFVPALNEKCSEKWLKGCLLWGLCLQSSNFATLCKNMSSFAMLHWWHTHAQICIKHANCVQSIGAERECLQVHRGGPSCASLLRETEEQLKMCKWLHCSVREHMFVSSCSSLVDDWMHFELRGGSTGLMHGDLKTTRLFRCCKNPDSSFETLPWCHVQMF